MANTPILQSKRRDIVGKKVKQLRRRGEIPGVVYGHGVENKHIRLNVSDYNRTFSQAGTSTLVDLVIDDTKPVKVLLHEPQLHPTKATPLHADFYAVKMTEKLQTEIPLHFVGEAEAVTLLDGTLTNPIDTVDVECYPDKLVPAITVNISTLKTFEDLIRIGDIQVPEGIEILNDPEEVIAAVAAPRSEEELAELEEAPTGEEADQAAVEGLEVIEEKPVEEEPEVK